MKITRRQLRKIIKEEKRKLIEGPIGDAELNLETALGQLLDMYIDEFAEPDPEYRFEGIERGINRVLKLANRWAKNQKETEGIPRGDWE
jgi:hypothetical protein